MIRLIHGDDEFSIANALNSYLDALGPPDLRAPNVTVFEDAKVSLGEVIATARTIPFLVKRRAVVVKGRLEALDSRTGRPNGDWNDFSAIISREGMQIVNELIFVENVPLRMNSAALKALASIAEVEKHDTPRREQMANWIRARFRHHGLDATPEAISRFQQLGGDETRRLDSEIEKLALYADGRTVQRADVELMVSDAHQEGIFKVIDAIIDGNPRLAVGGLHNLLANGESMGGIFRLLNRQLRILIIANHLQASRVSPADIGRRLNIRFDWLVRKTCNQAANAGAAALRDMHRQLFEIEMETKTAIANRELTISNEDLAIEMLVARMANRRRLSGRH